MRQTGVSAVEKFWTVYRHLEALERERHHGFRHPMFASDRLAAPLSLGVVHAGSWPSTVPEELVAEGRYGVFPGEDVEAARDAFEMAIREASMDDDWLREHPPELEWIEGQFEPGETSLDAPLLSDLVSCHEEILATTPPTHGVSYGSDLRLFTRYAEMPAVLYGPGDVRLAHAANERLPIDELVSATEVLTLMVARSIDA
jgi:acetylornithine deacetylase